MTKMERAIYIEQQENLDSKRAIIAAFEPLDFAICLTFYDTPATLAPKSFWGKDRGWPKPVGI